MTSSTTPDGILVWTTVDPASIVTESAAQASTIQIALDRRQNYDFRWANAAARAAQLNMVYGSQGFQVDTGEGFFYDGASWKLWDKPLTSFTPTLSGIAPGTTGTNTASWSMSSGRAFVEGSIVLNGTGFSVGSVNISVPITSVVSAANTPRGLATLADAGITSYQGVVVYNNTTTCNVVVTNVAGTYPNFSLLSATVPFTWAATDYISYQYAYVPA
jgi:hypothetical protein